MKSIKCPQCGLVYWATDPACKRCGITTVDPSPVDAANVEPNATQPQHAPRFTPPQPMMNLGENPAKAKLLKNLKGDAIFFYVIGGLQIVLWFIMGNLIIVDGFFNIGLSFLAHRFRSRVAAIFLLGLTLLGVMLGFLAIGLLGIRVGYLLPFTMIARIFAAARMVYSTFKLNGYVAEGPVKWLLPPPPPDFHQDAARQWMPPDSSPQWQTPEHSS